MTTNLNQPAMTQQRAAGLEACELNQAGAFAGKTSHVTMNNAIMPTFMQKSGSGSKENSGEPSLPPAQNPLTRLRQEIRSQQNNSNLYEQIQQLAEQLKLSQ
jgi:hypothetical protein